MRRICFLGLLFATTALAAPDPYASLRPAVAKIVGGAYDGAVLTQLTDLSDNVGQRLTGTKAYTKGVEWTVAQLKAAGAQNVHTEMFTLEHGWQRGPARASITSPVTRALHVESMGWAPAGSVRAPVVIAKPEALLPPAQLKGKIILFDFSTMPEGFASWIVVHKSIYAIKAAGGLAVIFQPALINNVIGTGAPATDGKVLPLPVAAMGLEDARYVARLVERGPTTVELSLTNTVSGPTQVANVIGELKGSSDDWIMLGAHLDSWDFATGSQDNGAGVVQVIQAARLLAGAGPLRRTVRFALWGGEEQGDVGSKAYVNAHASELERCVAYLNTDNGAGHVRGWKVQKRKDVQAALAPIAKQVLAPLGGSTVDMTITPDTDHFAFLQAGVPALDLLVDMTGYEPIHHRQGDTIDKVDAHALSSGLAVLATTALAIAQSSERIGPRLARPAVEELFKPEGLDAIARFEGWWK